MELLQKRGGSDFLKELSEAMLQRLMDANYLMVRDGGRVVSIAAIIATAINQDGRREILGLGLGASEAATFWLSFCAICTSTASPPSSSSFRMPMKG